MSNNKRDTVELLREFNDWRRGVNEDQAMPDVTAVGVAIDEICEEVVQARGRITELEEELESHAWEISPAMAQATIDGLNAALNESSAIAERLGAALLEVSLLKQDLEEISEIITKGGTTDEVLRFIAGGKEVAE